jgi:hypothetical protein
MSGGAIDYRFTGSKVDRAHILPEGSSVTWCGVGVDRTRNFLKFDRSVPCSECWVRHMADSFGVDYSEVK